MNGKDNGCSEVYFYLGEVMKKVILIFLFVISSVVTLFAQPRSFSSAYDEYIPYCYRSPSGWKWIREHDFDRRNMQDSLRKYTSGATFHTLICPWWLEDLYHPDNVAGRCKRIGYVGYVLNPLTGKPFLTNGWNDPGLLDSAFQDIPLDLVVYCRGGEAFDYFLESEEAQLNFLHTVFDPGTGMINKLHHGRRPGGIHFYLPDLSFRRKYAFVQFIRAVSMVIDHYCVDGVRPYENEKCMLYCTFDTTARKELPYLSVIMELADTVFLGTYNEYGVPGQSTVAFDYKNNPSPVVLQVYNFLLLFSLRLSDVDVEKGCCGDIDQLAKSDYYDENWRVYFLADIGLVLLLVVLVVLYMTHSPFYMFAYRYRAYIIPVIITIITEILIVFLYMAEALSLQEVFFSLEDNTHLYLLALPLLFILIHIAFKTLGKQERLP